MTKSDFVKEFRLRTGKTYEDATNCVDTFIEILTDILSLGGKINFPGFGTFKVNHIKGRTVEHPVTKEICAINERNIARFEQSDILRDRIQAVDYGRIGKD